MSGFSDQVYNGPVEYAHDQALNAEYLPTFPFQPESYLVDTRAFNNGLTHYSSTPSSIDQYSEAYSTPNSYTMNLESHVAQEPRPLHASHADIPQAFTVQPTEISSYTGLLHYSQHSQTPAPFYSISPSTPNGSEYNGPDWSDHPRLEAPFRELSNCMKLMPNEPLPKDKLIRFLERIVLPPSPKGRGSRRGAQGYICLWPGCRKANTRRDHGAAHVATHFGSKPFMCDKCHRGFLRPADKRRHLKQSCNKREMSSVSIDSSSSSNSSGGSTSGSGSGEEPSRYTSQIEVWRSIMGHGCLVRPGSPERLAWGVDDIPARLLWITRKKLIYRHHYRENG